MRVGCGPGSGGGEREREGRGGEGRGDKRRRHPTALTNDGSWSRPGLQRRRGNCR